MHKLRRAARKEESNYNPFARLRYSYAPRQQEPGGIQVAQRRASEDGQPSDDGNDQTQQLPASNQGTAPEDNLPVNATSNQLHIDPEDVESGPTRIELSANSGTVPLHRRKLWSLSLRQKRQDIADDVDFVSSMAHKQKFTVWSQIRYTVFNSWANILLVFVPAGFAVNYTNQSPEVIFAINFIAVVPIALMLSFISDELILRTGDLWGALINSTFSNAVQLIASILLLKNGLINILQISLIGSILANMHLTLGLGFFLGGMNREAQYFNMTVGQLFGTMLLLAMAGLIIPTVLSLLQGGKISPDNILHISRAIAVVLLIAYAFFLWFQLKTHQGMFNEPSKKSERIRKPKTKKRGDARKAMVQIAGGVGALAAGEELRENTHVIDNYEEIKEEPQISLMVAILYLPVLTTFLGFNTAFATDSLNGLIEHTELTETFIGMVLLPLLSVDFTLFSTAMKDKMDLFIAVTVGKCLQTALLITPFIVLLGWMMGVCMGLNFDAFEVVALFASVLYINSMIQEGKSYYLQGVLLLGLYIIICIASYCVPSNIAPSC